MLIVVYAGVMAFGAAFNAKSLGVTVAGIGGLLLSGTNAEWANVAFACWFLSYIVAAFRE